MNSTRIDSCQDPGGSGLWTITPTRRAAGSFYHNAGLVSMCSARIRYELQDPAGSDIAFVRTSASLTRVLVAASTAFAFTLAWRLLTFSGFNNDHYVHLARAQQV